MTSTPPSMKDDGPPKEEEATLSSTTTASSESVPIPVPSVPPRNNKLAAMVQRAAAATAAAATTTTTSSSDVPSADSFSGSAPDLASIPTQSQPVQPRSASTAGGGRGSNKLAALAARQQKQDDTPAAASTMKPKAGKNLGNVINSSSAIQQQQQQQAQKEEEQKLVCPEEIAQQKADHLVRLQVQMKKRHQLLDNLDQAEELTCRLLSIAAQTMDVLQDVHWATTGQEALSDLSSAYSNTIQAIHPLVCGDDAGNLVKAYQNHGKETQQSMYAARLEYRLAKERLQVIQAFAQLEQEQQEHQQQQQQQQKQKQQKTFNTDRDTDEGSVMGRKRTLDETQVS
ncbi:hypothetical protein IV203_014602 [Nitzschia inconspicua]|uniref:Uncharacterized protein n=1 Tax=Nitzschia inconspicua TaxID=303405 RepID=A0A9K3PSA7_9STRA|nr:hypothetical protein IV203_014602 [Nitzschia inconspicua]